MPRNKYHNKPETVDGIKFDSIKEAKRYTELKAMEQNGDIHGLELQPAFVLQESFPDPRVGFRKDGKPRAVRGIKYIADFRYVEGPNVVVEDVKGMKTTAYNLKKSLFLRRYPEFDFREI